MNKIYPETLLQLMLDVLKHAPEFSYIRGIQPFLMSFDGKEYFVYVKNLSSAYFKERPDTTRAQLPMREEFEEIKKSSNRFVFLGYDQNNDVLVCWNFHVAKTRLNVGKSVSFYSRQFFQDEVSSGVFLRKCLKNGDEPILFKRKNLVDFFRKIDSFFPVEQPDDNKNSSLSENLDLDVASEHENLFVSNGKLLKITDAELIEQLRPLINTKHSLEAIKLAANYYVGQFPAMKLKDWNELIKNIDFKESIDEVRELVEPVDPFSSNMNLTEMHRVSYVDFMLSQNISNNTIKRYENAISGILTNLIKEHYAPQINSIFNVSDTTMLQSWADKLFMRLDFIELNKLKHRYYSCALNNYIKYTESLPKKEDAIIAAEQLTSYRTPDYCESLFMRFMQDGGLSENSGKYYIQALNGRITECIRKYLFSELNTIFSITEIQTLYSWTQSLHRNHEFKEMNDTGNRLYSCALNKYTQFVEFLSSKEVDFVSKPQKQYIIPKTIKPTDSVKRKEFILKVTYPNGRVVSERVVYKTLLDVIEIAGARNVQSLGIFVNKINLVSDMTFPRYEISQKPIGNGLFVMTNCDTDTKLRIIEQISESLNMGLKVEKISIL